MRWMLRSVSAVWGAQTLAMVFQLVYLAVASRVVPEEDFASFAVAVLVATFGVMLLQSSVGRASARRPSEDVAGDRALVSVTVVIGAAIALTIALLSPLIAVLWKSPQATAIVALMGLQVPLLGLSGVQVGVLRRTHRINALASAQVAAGGIGVLAGILAVLMWPSAYILAVQPLVTAALLALLNGSSIRYRSLPGRVTRDSLSDLAFGVRAGYSGVLSYIFYGLPQWAMSVSLGPTTFANWNRAVTVAQVPIDLMARSIATVAYPRFRSHEPTSNVRAKWTGMLATSALLVFPLLGSFLLVAPDLVELVIGSEWIDARLMAPWILVAAVIGLQGSLLANALESSSHFRSLWQGQYATIPILVVGAILVLLYADWLPATAAFILAAAVAHAVQIRTAARTGLVYSHRLIKVYAISMLLGFAFFMESGLVAQLHTSPALALINAVLVSSAYLCILYRRRHSWALVPAAW